MSDPQAGKATLQPRFIASQGIKRLDLSIQQRTDVKSYVLGGRDSDAFAEADSSDKESERRSEKKTRWQPIDRFVSFQSFEHRKICITVDGGYGKSIALQQLQFIRQAAHPDHLVLLCELSDLPTQSSFYLVENGPDLENPLLVELVIEQITKSMNDRTNMVQSATPTTSQLSCWLTALIRSGRLTLQVDGLDQAALDTSPKRIRALRRFLQQYPNLRIVVAGRPTGIADLWDLFGTGPDKLGSDWEFWLVSEFTESEVKQYVGSRFDRMVEMNATNLFVPRTLEVVRTLTDDEFDKCLTASDIYWHSVSRTLRVDTAKQTEAKRITDFSPTQVMDLFAAVAFVLLSWKGKPVTQIESDKAFRTLIKRLGSCFRKVLGLKKESESELEQDRFTKDILDQLAKWARWCDQSCRMPWEDEWEYAVKIGLKREQWHWRYWWGDDVDLEKLNCYESKLGTTIVATSKHASPATINLDSERQLGLMEMLGNVWQWCQDIYRPTAGRRLEDEVAYSSRSRVCRGGSFLIDATDVRCSTRSFDVPTIAFNSNGFRLSRADLGKS